jgi:RHS repeat-associated protein
MFIYHNLRALGALLLILITGKAVAQNRSQVIEEVIKVSGITQESQIGPLNSMQKQVTKTYLDGFGRPVQVISVGASPAQKNIIQPIVYNSLGQQVLGYLPFAGSDASGSFHGNAIAEQAAFYAATGQKTATDPSPYSQQVFENSPMQRVLQTGSVGTGFQPGQHYKSFSYGLNLASETVRRWNSDGSAATAFAAGSLRVSAATDEEGGKTVAYTDGAGKTVLKKEWLNVGGVSWLETYYVYGDAGQLLFVVPPKAAAAMVASGNFSLSQAGLSGLLFRYAYDDLGRQVERTVPGGGTNYMVYDTMDRVVLAQDEKLRSQNKWNYIKYDSRNVAVSQGIYTDASHIGRASMQAYVNGLDLSINYYEERNGNVATGYYTNRAFPVSGTEPLAYSYFDDYDLDGNGTADYAYQSQGMAGEKSQALFIKGMPTVVRKRTVGAGLGNIWLITAVFYDRDGNTVQTQSNNQLNSSVNSLETMVPDFRGKTIRKKSVMATLSVITVQTEYTYDHMDRPKTVDEGYNGNAAVRIAAYEYNELGQLVDRKLHSTNSGTSYLQSVDYRYNIQGQMTSINNSGLSVDSRNDDTNDVFGMELLYSQADAGIGNSGYFNGMLSAVKWKVNAPGVATGNERSYRFAYDKLMRLNAAVYAERSGGGAWNNNGAFDEKNISYDLNGNILTLQRNAILSGSITAVDDLNYSYDGNRLSNVTDGTGGSYGLFGFKNVTGSGAAYGYDASGNMAIDAKKGISLDYNILNRTDKVTVNTASGRYITYTYQAGGNLIRKQAFDNNSLVKTTDYIGGSVYENNVLSYFGMAEGRVRNTGGTLKLEYMIRDQQGNVRVSFEEQGGLAVVRQENSYYPFGLTMPGSVTPTAANKNLYNGGSEWQNDFGDLPDLQQTFYRMYDAALGRFVAADPMAEASESMTVYQYALNSPLIFNDPLGDKAAGYFPNSHRIGPGSGNHWSDGMMFSDWDGWGGGSDTYRYLLSQGYTDWGNDMVMFSQGEKMTYGEKEGKMGYWTSGITEETGYSTYFNALSGKMEESRNVGGTKATWHEMGINNKPVSGWESFASEAGKINWMASLTMTAAQNTPGSFRTSTSKFLLSPKYYRNGWWGNQYVKTFDFSHVGKLGGRGLVITGIVIDGFSWNNGTITSNKFAVNTSVALWGLTGVGTVPSIFYFGTEAFVPGGFEGFMAGAETGFSETKRILGPSWRPVPLGGK